MKALFIFPFLIFSSCYSPEDSPNDPADTPKRVADLDSSSDIKPITKVDPYKPKALVLKDTLHIFKNFPSNHDKVKDFKIFHDNFYIAQTKEAEFQKDLNYLNPLTEWNTHSFPFKIVDSLILKWKQLNIPHYN